MAKPRAWTEGVSHDSHLTEKEGELLSLLPAAVVYIREHPGDSPHLTDPVLVRILALLEDKKKVSDLVEQWHFQNLHSMLEGLLEKVGFQNGDILQELFWVCSRILNRSQVGK